MIIAEGDTNGSLRRFCSAVIENNLLPDLKRPIPVKVVSTDSIADYHWYFDVDEDYAYNSVEIILSCGKAVVKPVGFEHTFSFGGTDDG